MPQLLEQGYGVCRLQELSSSLKVFDPWSTLELLSAMALLHGPLCLPPGQKNRRFYRVPGNTLSDTRKRAQMPFVTAYLDISRYGNRYWSNDRKLSGHWTDCICRRLNIYEIWCIIGMAGRLPNDKWRPWKKQRIKGQLLTALKSRVTGFCDFAGYKRKYWRLWDEADIRKFER